MINDKRGKKILVKILTNSIGILLTSYLLRGMEVKGVIAAIVAAILLSLVNLYIRPVVTVLSLPLTILTLGLFTVVINALMLSLTAWLVPGVVIYGFWTAILGAILISFFSALISAIFD